MLIYSVSDSLSLANVYIIGLDRALANMTYEMADLYFKTLW